jgi:hypothetical protein
MFHYSERDSILEFLKAHKKKLSGIFSRKKDETKKKGGRRRLEERMRAETDLYVKNL